MCGIAGILIFANQFEKLNLVKKMTDSIIHRGPDGGHTWTNFKNVSLGHRRLSILDLSSKASQPMSSFNERYIIVFNGEIYNYLELKKDLLNKGFDFKTESDTEVLLNLFISEGKNMLNYLNGMFAFAIWDTLEEKLFCARDRFGEKPFYYKFEGKTFYFASEMKAIFAASGSPQLNQTLLNNYLINDLVVNPNNEKETFYLDIHKLEKAHLLEIDIKGKLNIERYYSINRSQKKINFEDASHIFHDLLLDSVSKRLRSDVPVGTSLSGGLDSSIIAYLVNVVLMKGGDKMKNVSFSARFKEIGFDESEFLDSIVDSIKIDNHSIFPNSDLIHEDLTKVFYHQEEPFQSASILNQWSVMQLAKNNSTVVLLDGQGADEMLGGYSWYYKVYLKELYLKSKKDYHKEVFSAKANGLVVQSIGFKDWLRLNFSRIDKIAQELNIKRLKSNQDLKNFNQDFFNPNSQNIARVKSYENNLNQVLFEDFNSNILETLLRFADRNSMAFSREIRLAFLDHKLVDFVFSLPSEFKIHEGWKKYIQRKSFENKIPNKIIWRKDKIGYAAPQNSWMKSEKNKAYFNDAISDLVKNKVLVGDKNISEKFKWKILMVRQLINFTKHNFNA